MGKWHLGEICPECGGPVRRILWGMVMADDAERAARKGWIIGGCCVDDRHSTCGCGAIAYDIDGNPAGAGFDSLEPVDVPSDAGGRTVDQTRDER
jgi:hypothetical protein